MAAGMAEICRALARQNAYANNILFQVAAKLTVAELEAAQSPSRTSAYGLLVHLLTAEAFYLTQVGGDARPINQESITTIDQLVSLATAHNEGFVAFVATLHDEDLARKVTVAFSDKSQVRYLVWQVLACFINRVWLTGRLMAAIFFAQWSASGAGWRGMHSREVLFCRFAAC